MYFNSHIRAKQYLQWFIHCREAGTFDNFELQNMRITTLILAWFLLWHKFCFSHFLSVLLSDQSEYEKRNRSLILYKENRITPEYSQFPAAPQFSLLVLLDCVPLVIIATRTSQ